MKSKISYVNDSILLCYGTDVQYHYRSHVKIKRHQNKKIRISMKNKQKNKKIGIYLDHFFTEHGVDLNFGPTTTWHQAFTSRNLL